MKAEASSFSTRRMPRLLCLLVISIAGVFLLLPGCTTSGTETASDTAPRFIDVSVGRGHMLALDKEGQVWSWGSNYNGELGRKTKLYAAADIPSPVYIGEKISSVCAQGNTSFAVSNTGVVYGWGGSRYGELASESHVGTSVGVMKPTKIRGAEGAVDIACGSPLTVVLTSDSTLVYWGGHVSKDSPSDSFRTVPDTLQAAKPIQDFDTGSTFAVALIDGSVWGYGDDTRGVFGQEKRKHRLEKIQLVNESFEDVEAGLDFVVGRTNKGSVYSWGGNEFMQRGSLEVVVGLSLVNEVEDIKKLSAASFFTLAIDVNGDVYSWGDNRSGQLGRSGTRKDYGLPGKVDGLKGISEVSAGNYTAAAVDSSGVVYTWGVNESLELGRPDNVGTSAVSTLPSPIVVDPGLYPRDLDFGL